MPGLGSSGGLLPHLLLQSSLLLSSLELRDTKVYEKKSMILKYEPSSEPLHNSAK